MNKKVLMLLTIATGAYVSPLSAIAFTYKGGPAPTIGIGIFKDEGHFKNYLKYVIGMEGSADVVQKFTQENAKLIGHVAAGATVAGLIVATVASEGTLTPVTVGSAASLASTVGKNAQLLTQLTGKLAKLTSLVVGHKIEGHFLMNHYFPTVKVGQTVCRGGPHKVPYHPLIRNIQFPSAKQDFMDLNKPYPIFIAIFNNNAVTSIASKNEIIYAGPVDAKDVFASFDVTTAVVDYKDANNKSTQKALGVRFVKTDSDMGRNCTIK